MVKCKNANIRQIVEPRQVNTQKRHTRTEGCQLKTIAEGSDGGINEGEDDSPICANPPPSLSSFLSEITRFATS